MANRETFTILEAKTFFLKNPPHQFKITDQKGNNVTRWLQGTQENVTGKLDELDTNEVYQDGIYFICTRTSTSKNSHNAAFTVVKGDVQKTTQPVQNATLNDHSEFKNAEKLPLSEILNILSENKILKFKVETLEKTIEHLNHEIDNLEEQIEESHHDKSGMNEGVISALLPLGDRLLSIIESRTGSLAEMNAAAPASKTPTVQPLQYPTKTAPIRTAAAQAAPQQPQPAAGAAATATEQPTDAENIAALIIKRVENNPENPNALSQQMEALLKSRPDIYETVANLLTQYYSEQ